MLLDVRDKAPEAVRDFMSQKFLSAKSILLIHAPDQDTRSLLEGVSFAGLVDTVCWPTPIRYLSHHLAVLSQEVRRTARLKAQVQGMTQDAPIVSLGDKFPFLLLIWNMEGQLDYANADARSFFALDGATVQGVDLLSFVHKNERDPLFELAETAVRRRTTFQTKARYRRSDGSWRWMEVAGGPIVSEEGDLKGVISCLTDITDQKSASDLLASQEEMFRELADSLPIQVWRSDASGYTFYFNRAWSEYTGLPARYITQEEWLSIEHPDDIPALKKQWWAAVHRDQPFSVEFRLKEHKTGLLKWMWSQAVPIRNEAGRVVGWLGASLDIDREKREAERISLLYEDLVELDRAKDTFILSLSQDMQTPLRDIIRRSSALMEVTSLTPEDHEAMEAVYRNTTSLLRTVNDLLDMSRILTGTMFLQREKIDLIPIVQSVLAALQPSFQQSGVILRTALPESVPVCADPRRLHQIVWNIVSNALKFTPRGGTVQVTGRERDSSVVLSVQDTGKGVDPAFMPRIFELFAQEEGYQTRAHGGLGLGLPLAKYLTELQGGQIRITSPGSNQGTRVDVSLVT